MCSVHQGVFSTLGGYHEYMEEDTMSILGDIMSRLGDVQYIGVAS